MIRLPFSSINLSEHDLAFHLQQIDIYHGLLKQGFNKTDILRYFKEHRETNDAADRELDIAAPSTVDLAVRSPPLLQVSDLSRPPHTGKSSSNDGKALDDVRSNAQGLQDASEPQGTVQPSPTTALVLPSGRHAPRQSSLLRFTQVISSDSTQSDATEDLSKNPALPARTYRPRTETYSYNQSEASEDELTGNLSGLRIASATLHDHTSIIELPQASASPMRPDVESFVPEHLRRSLSAGRDNSTSQSAQTRLLQNPNGPTYQSSTPHVPLSVITPRRSSLGATRPRTVQHGSDSSQRSEFPSSPPGPAWPVPPHSGSSPPLPAMPTTPNPARRPQRDIQTEPRSQSPQYLDGSFPVYNDSLPASNQPQTPADLARQYVITEHEAAYTAPVGRVHTPSASRLRDAALLNQPEPGEQSPTRRAIGMRERRARELLRSTRAEGLRLERMRRQERERVARGVEGNAEWRDRQVERARIGPGPAVVAEQWEDQLEGDRVGDENWEGELEVIGVGGERRIRVTSGNAIAGRAG